MELETILGFGLWAAPAWSSPVPAEPSRAEHPLVLHLNLRCSEPPTPSCGASAGPGELWRTGHGAHGTLGVTCSDSWRARGKQSPALSLLVSPRRRRQRTRETLTGEQALCWALSSLLPEPSSRNPASALEPGRVPEFLSHRRFPEGGLAHVVVGSRCLPCGRTRSLRFLCRAPSQARTPRCPRRMFQR